MISCLRKDEAWRAHHEMQSTRRERPCSAKSTALFALPESCGPRGAPPVPEPGPLLAESQAPKRPVTNSSGERERVTIICRFAQPTAATGQAVAAIDTLADKVGVVGCPDGVVSLVKVDYHQAGSRVGSEPYPTRSVGRTLRARAWRRYRVDLPQDGEYRLRRNARRRWSLRAGCQCERRAFREAAPSRTWWQEQS